MPMTEPHPIGLSATFAPHLGQVSAFELTSAPHSLHLISAIVIIPLSAGRSRPRHAQSHLLLVFQIIALEVLFEFLKFDEHRANVSPPDGPIAEPNGVYVRNTRAKLFK